jgi:hypothetical protein
MCNNFNLNANGLNIDRIPETLRVQYQLKQRQKIQRLVLVHMALMKKDLVFMITRKNLPLFASIMMIMK